MQAAAQRDHELTVSDPLYAFLKAHHKEDVFEGRNGRARWSDYSWTVTRSYQQLLEKRGFARIPACESSTEAPVFFDRELRIIEGERLRYAESGQFLDFDQRAFLASMTVSPYDVQTTSMGECVMGATVRVGGCAVALVWSDCQSDDSESRVMNAINRAVCNSRAAPTFIELLKATRQMSRVSVETFL